MEDWFHFMRMFSWQVVEEAGENFLTLTLKARTALFARNLRQLLHNQPEHVVSLGNLVSVYQKTFGHRCKVANFGFSRLTDLIETLPHVAKVIMFLLHIHLLTGWARNCKVVRE